MARETNDGGDTGPVKAPATRNPAPHAGTANPDSNPAPNPDPNSGPVNPPPADATVGGDASRGSAAAEARAEEKELRQEVKQWRERAQRAELDTELRRALSTVDWFDDEDAFRDLAGRVEQERPGAWRVVAPSETPDAPPRKLSLREAVRELAARKPHWVRARVFGGSGAGSGAGGPPPAGALTYQDLLRPENQELLRNLLHNRPEELARLREQYLES